MDSSYQKLIYFDSVSVCFRLTTSFKCRSRHTKKKKKADRNGKKGNALEYEILVLIQKHLTAKKFFFVFFFFFLFQVDSLHLDANVRGVTERSRWSRYSEGVEVPHASCIIDKGGEWGEW